MRARLDLANASGVTHGKIPLNRTLRSRMSLQFESLQKPN